MAKILAVDVYCRVIVCRFEVKECVVAVDAAPARSEIRERDQQTVLRVGALPRRAAEIRGTSFPAS